MYRYGDRSWRLWVKAVVSSAIALLVVGGVVLALPYRGGTLMQESGALVSLQAPLVLPGREPFCH